MMKMTVSNPASIASYRENSMIGSLFLPTGASCLRPPKRLPIPAAMMTSIGFFIYVLLLCPLSADKFVLFHTIILPIRMQADRGTMDTGGSPML
jgi:hypothetical protein